MDREFISVAIGHRNSAGDWIVDERPDVQSHPTRQPQIWITPNLSKLSKAKGDWVLTHAETGFFLLGPFMELTQAREAADRLVTMLPLNDWNVMGRTDGPDGFPWQRDRVKDRVKRLSMEDRQWLREHGAFSIQ
jgi:hypothetical protein